MLQEADSFCCICGSEEEMESWIEAVNKAIADAKAKVEEEAAAAAALAESGDGEAGDDGVPAMGAVRRLGPPECRRKLCCTNC